jgi:hypothetical protein
MGERSGCEKGGGGGNFFKIKLKVKPHTFAAAIVASVFGVGYRVHSIADTRCK